MVSVKRRLPRHQLTASHALNLARAYIADRAPHILAENGGHINLKITWAMKLVSRTNERWREITGTPPQPPQSQVIEENSFCKRAHTVKTRVYIAFAAHFDAKFTDLIAEFNREVKNASQGEQ